MISYEIGAKHTIVFFLHGLRGHGLSHETALQHFVKNSGVRVISLELKGHGHDSSRHNCMVQRYTSIVKDIVQDIHEHAINADQIILMGHSFGASLMMLVADQLREDELFKQRIAGLIGINTAFDVAHNVPKWQIMLSKLIAWLSRFSFERSPRTRSWLSIPEINLDAISGDPLVKAHIQNDPLVYKGPIPLHTSVQVHQAGVAAKAALKTLSIPTLLVHSKDDSIALPPSLDDFEDNVSLKLFKGLRHDCLDGTSRESFRARKAIINFIVNKL